MKILSVISLTLMMNSSASALDYKSLVTSLKHCNNSQLIDLVSTMQAVSASIESDLQTLLEITDRNEARNFIRQYAAKTFVGLGLDAESITDLEN